MIIILIVCWIILDILLAVIICKSISGGRKHDNDLSEIEAKVKKAEEFYQRYK